MSRHQFRHGRTLDALELRGGVVMSANQAEIGDTILDLDGDYVVTAKVKYPADEFVYVLHPRTTKQE